MPSHLTRHVFRCILANEPLIHRGCLRRRTYSALARTTAPDPVRQARHALYINAKASRRTFFNFSIFGRRRDVSKEADMPLGMEMMMGFAKRQRMRARLPPPQDVARALKQFFSAPAQGLHDTQARLIAQCLRYCHDHQNQDKRPHGRPLITTDVFQGATACLRRSITPTDSHVELAKLLYEIADTCGFFLRKEMALAYVKMLVGTGRPVEARDFMLQHESRMGLTQPESAQLSRKEQEDAEMEGAANQQYDQRMQVIPHTWALVLEGFANGDSEIELLNTLDMMKARGVDRHPIVALRMLDFYTRQNDRRSVQNWFGELWERHVKTMRTSKVRPTTALAAQAMHRVLLWCLSNNEAEFGQEVVRRAMAEVPAKPIWDAVFVWAAGNGKGADEIARMFTVMETALRSSSDLEYPRQPDVATINALVEFATSKNDPYLAERFINLGVERNIQPDARTYVLQMEYRLKVDDVDGALVAYQNLQSMDLSSNEDVPSVNRLVVALCNSKRHDFDTIMNVTADLSDRRARFDPEVVSMLSILHLNRDELEDVADLLNTHAFHYSSSDRKRIQDAILDFCLNPATPTVRSWDAYAILRNTFDEMPRSQRTEVMVNFFRRERPDMAVHVFNNMRTHSRNDIIPTIETYAAAFLASAKLRDIESLEVIHNQLKLDYNINTNTYLYNALMVGYTACGKPRRALDFWDDIVASKEGPTYNSIHIALRACERAPFGDRRAQEIWSKLRKMSVELDQSMWSSYVPALAGNGDNELAFSTVEEAESKGEIEVDAFLLGSLMNGAAGQAKQAEVEAWARERYPHLWEELVKIGIESDEAGMRTAKIDRTVAP